jgi:hypothetical protein
MRSRTNYIWGILATFSLPVGYLNTLRIKIYRNTVILYGCDTSHLSLREEQQVEAL